MANDPANRAADEAEEAEEIAGQVAANLGGYTYRSKRNVQAQCVTCGAGKMLNMASLQLRDVGWTCQCGARNEARLIPKRIVLRTEGGEWPD